jgi:hypothetical protein
MGGKLFNLPRMPRDEYLAREAEVRRALDGLLGGAYRIPRFYGDKPDFGDMDVIVAGRPDWEAVRAEIMRALGVTEWKTPGHVLSMAFRGLQTDFFVVPERYLDSTANFMSFNDLGNFIGRICRRFDLKYGERGLSYVFRREGGSYKAELEITQDLGRICAFLGLDHAAWVAGFPSLPAMFDWVIASPFFSVAPYLDEAAGAMARRQERSTVTRFVAYLRERGIDRRPDLGDRRARLPTVAAAFPDADIERWVQGERDKEARQAQLSARFSGRRVMRLLPGLAGAALGAFIVAFRASVPDFEAFLLGASDEEIDRRILDFAGRP